MEKAERRAAACCCCARTVAGDGRGMEVIWNGRIGNIFIIFISLSSSRNGWTPSSLVGCIIERHVRCKYLIVHSTRHSGVLLHPIVFLPLRLTPLKGRRATVRAHLLGRGRRRRRRFLGGRGHLKWIFLDSSSTIIYGYTCIHHIFIIRKANSLPRR